MDDVIGTPHKEQKMFDLGPIAATHATDLSRAQFRLRRPQPAPRPWRPRPLG